MNLITRADMDGVACAVLITSVENISQVIYADPSDVEAGHVLVAHGDVIANLPFHANAGLWFDHHDEAVDEAWQTARAVPGKRGLAPSAARLVFEHYQPSPLLKRYEEMVRWTDKFDSAKLTREEVTTPTGWVLLGFTLDPVMGLKAYTGYANAVVAAIRGGAPIEAILDSAEVRGRVNRYLTDADDFEAALKQNTRLEGNVIITDLRDNDEVPSGNRFVAFSLFPKGNVQLVLTLDRERDMVRVRVGKSIFDRSSQVNLGHLMSQFGGGGLAGAGGCLLDPAWAETKIKDIVRQLKEG